MSSETKSEFGTKSAWLYNRTGKPKDVLYLEKGLHIPNPAELGPYDVLVEVVATSINPLDYKLMNTYQMIAKALFKLPNIPGYDFAGRVLAVGSEVKEFSATQRVWGCQSFPRAGRQGGSCATHIVTGDKDVWHLPDGVSFNEGAGFGIAGLTAWEVLVRQMKVKPGTKLVIEGASGGVGTFAVALAKALECEVTTISSTENLDLCKSLGATHTLDYKKDNLVERLADLGPYDFVFDCVNDNVLYRASSKFVKPDGAFFGIGGDITLSYVGSRLSRTLRPRVLGGSSHSYYNILLHVDQEMLRDFVDFVMKHNIKTVIDSVYDFEDTVEAFNRLMTHRCKGKVIIKTD
ncbi:mitochondrial CH-OH group oxidoreductase, human RTN4IP1 ortholog, implicated in mitochondrial organization or tethering [Schizosaccharomyces pombe]|uniref:Zinc-type alcohol dehydrogenase-like protein C16A3.02c n=1 Tax=Schizosaccharomyces pombe (strain 972 / ATCC 24843) TaxID=284812 RepID=YBI2_SCHPO|nr:uncharacterized protein SPBC16A3.02c [Schizosaccharomyces pombe]O42909.1 RecName: Full=Zinc-type alcohol dehydrogenase-like protein C16A3.02c [Schizosaccharomyces pombe 972h-]CAA16853.1 mitochondrial conserved protein (predicted) [Schizosaccharomyces pombe]|eukprot:NP_596787.1 uncharacterized protein SPBC16A3.02c [Schizosaccharomyces pombe]